MAATTDWVKMDMLVTVKAYPSISQTYGEAICVAGVRVDTDTPEWVRLYPVQFRSLPPEQRFSKYALIRLDAQQHSGDRRSETWRPNLESIEVVQKLPAGKHWPARRQWVEPLIAPTMCELNRGRAGGALGPSLGLVRPARVLDVVAAAAEDWSQAQRNTLLQGNLLNGPARRDLEKPGHAFAYRWECEEPAAPATARRSSTGSAGRPTAPGAIRATTLSTPSARSGWSSAPRTATRTSSSATSISTPARF